MKISNQNLRKNVFLIFLLFIMSFSVCSAALASANDFAIDSVNEVINSNIESEANKSIEETKSKTSTEESKDGREFIIEMIELGTEKANEYVDKNGYDDVKSDYWAYDEIMWGIQKKVSSGYIEGMFSKNISKVDYKPEQNIVMKEFVTMLLKAFNKETYLEKDKRNGQYIGADAFWEEYKYPDFVNRPGPNSWEFSNRNNYEITRLDIVELVAAMDGKNYKGYFALQYVFNKQYLKGKIQNQYQFNSFSSYEPVTRAEALVIIKSLQDNGIKELKKSTYTPSPRKDLNKIPSKNFQSKIHEKIHNFLLNQPDNYYYKSVSKNDTKFVVFSDQHAILSSGKGFEQGIFSYSEENGTKKIESFGYLAPTKMYISFMKQLGAITEKDNNFINLLDKAPYNGKTQKYKTKQGKVISFSKSPILSSGYTIEWK